LKFDFFSLRVFAKKMLEVRQISINYGVCAVVRDVSFAVRAGEILAILGANGAGKTTLLRSLNNALPLAKGEILLDGTKIENLSRREIARKIAVVAQETETRFPVAVLEFVLAGRFAANSGAFGWETPGDLQAARRALLETDLANFERRLMNHLSGGERQRAVFARALAAQAKILLLDEPTANLDLQHQTALLKLLREKCDTENLSAVAVTHDLNLAAAFADRILLLKQGEIYAYGEPKTILTAENLQAVFAIDVLLDQNPANGKLRVTTIF
jgi:iron complex transport system ATP-binding protein